MGVFQMDASCANDFGTGFQFLVFQFMSRPMKSENLPCPTTHVQNGCSIAIGDHFSDKQPKRNLQLSKLHSESIGRR